MPIERLRREIMPHGLAPRQKRILHRAIRRRRLALPISHTDLSTQSKRIIGTLPSFSCNHIITSLASYTVYKLKVDNNNINAMSWIGGPREKQKRPLEGRELLLRRRRSTRFRRGRNRQRIKINSTQVQPNKMVDLSFVDPMMFLPPFPRMMWMLPRELLEELIGSALRIRRPKTREEDVVAVAVSLSFSYRVGIDGDLQGRCRAGRYARMAMPWFLISTDLDFVLMSAPVLKSDENQVAGRQEPDVDTHLQPGGSRMMRGLRRQIIPKLRHIQIRFLRPEPKASQLTVELDYHQGIRLTFCTSYTERGK